MTRETILGHLWLRFKPNAPRLVTGEVHPNDKFWSEFFAYNDLGLVLSFAKSNDLVFLSPKAQHYVDETWQLLCDLLGIDADREYKNLEHMFATSPYVSFEE